MNGEMFYISIYDEEIERVRRVQRGKQFKIYSFAKQKNKYSGGFTREFKRKIKERDGYQCQFPDCQEKKDLVVHHVLYTGFANFEEACVCLCRAHNGIVNKDKEKWKSYFMNKIHYKLMEDEENAHD